MPLQSDHVYKINTQKAAKLTRPKTKKHKQVKEPNQKLKKKRQKVESKPQQETLETQIYETEGKQIETERKGKSPAQSATLP